MIYILNVQDLIVTATYDEKKPPSLVFRNGEARFCLLNGNRLDILQSVPPDWMGKMSISKLSALSSEALGVR